MQVMEHRMYIDQNDIDAGRLQMFGEKLIHTARKQLQIDAIVHDVKLEVQQCMNRFGIEMRILVRFDDQSFMNKPNPTFGMKMPPPPYPFNGIGSI